MSEEYDTFKDIDYQSFTEKLQKRDLVSARLSLTDRQTGYGYKLTFVGDHPHGQYIIVHTEKRKEFLNQGSEENAQENLIKMGFKIQGITGGLFNIHPFYGAVWGTKLTPVSPDFCVDLEEPDDDLSMLIYLENNNIPFDDELTRKAMEIGPVVSFPSQKAREFIEYSQAVNGANPNQHERDIAVINDLGERWDEEFQRFNDAAYRQGMQLSAENIASLVALLAEEEIVLTSIDSLTVKK